MFSFQFGAVGFARYCADLPEATTVADGTFAIGAFPVDHNNADRRSFLTADVDSPSPRTGYWDASECDGCGFLDIGTVHQGQATITDTVIPLVRKCTVSISGVLTDVNGNPAASAFVSADSSTDRAFTFTGPSGEYSFPALLLGVDNAPTTYGISSRSDSDGSQVDVLQPVTACGSQLTVNLQLHVGYGSVRGVVRDKDTNAEIEGASVGFTHSVGFCYPDPGQNQCFATTGPGNGSYRIGNLAFSHPGDDAPFSMIASKQGDREDFQDVTIVATTDGNPAAIQDFLLLKKKFVVVTGVVRDLITGEPIANACSFELSPFDGPVTCTDATGHFTSAPLELGFQNEPRDICYEFTAEGHFPVEGCLTLDAAVPDAPPLEVRQMPLCEDATLTGRVTNVVTGAASRTRSCGPSVSKRPSRPTRRM